MKRWKNTGSAQLLIEPELTDHHLDGGHVELGAVAVDQGWLELLRGDAAGLVAVHAVKVFPGQQDWLIDWLISAEK